MEQRIARSLEELDAFFAKSGGEDIDIVILNDGRGEDIRPLYGRGRSNAIAIQGIHTGVFLAYLSEHFHDHLCVRVLEGETQVTDEMLQRIGDTIELTVSDARRMLEMQKSAKWRKWIRDQKPKAKRKPQPCKICRQLTDDEYALMGLPMYPVICPRCREEANCLSLIKSWGWITPDGNITPEFRRACKRHFQKNGSS